MGNLGNDKLSRGLRPETDLSGLAKLTSSSAMATLTMHAAMARLSLYDILVAAASQAMERHQDEIACLLAVTAERAKGSI